MSHSTKPKVDTMDKRNSIRIGLIGCVSSGKSTLLNSICVNQYEDMKTKRTTMLPTLYQETNTNIVKNTSEIKTIHQKNKEMNKMISSEGFKLTIDNCKVVENIIPKINDFIKLPRNVFTDIYDIPGLNDFQTRDIYFQWIENNFHNFDIIFHVVDVEDPLNTSDQLDILKLIVRNIKKEKEENNHDVFLITVINKCDEMEIDDNGNFLLDEENAENYTQIIQHTKEVIKDIFGKPSQSLSKRKNSAFSDVRINDLMFRFTPISAADTFIYRMLHNDPSVELDMKLLQKFGVNEVGKRTWNKMNDTERKKMIKQHFKNVDIKDTLLITGYIELTNILNNYLTTDKIQSILIHRLKKEINHPNNISKQITNNQEKITELCNMYNSYSIKIWNIDKLFKTNNSNIISELIKNHIVQWIQTYHLSNSTTQELSTLEEFKLIYKKFYQTLDSYFLDNNVQLVIDSSKKSLWNVFYSEDKLNEITNENKTLSISSILLSIIKGISQKQNDYYLNKLSDNSTYQNFPSQIYHNLNCLIQNKYIHIDDVISDVLNFILKMTYAQTIIPTTTKVDIFQKLYNSSLTSDDKQSDIFDSFIFSKFVKEDFSNDNFNPNQITIIGFCEFLIFHYNYPVKFIREFLYKYMIGYYTLIQDKRITNIIQQNVYNKSYTILLNNWLDVIIHHSYNTDDLIKMKPDYLSNMKNLYIINKSYMNISDNLPITLDTSNCISNHNELIDYTKYEQVILAIPKYYHFISNTKLSDHQKSYKKHKKYIEHTDDDEFYDVQNTN